MNYVHDAFSKFYMFQKFCMFWFLQFTTLNRKFTSWL